MVALMRESLDGRSETNGMERTIYMAATSEHGMPWARAMHHLVLVLHCGFDVNFACIDEKF